MNLDDLKALASTYYDKFFQTTLVSSPRINNFLNHYVLYETDALDLVSEVRLEEVKIFFVSNGPKESKPRWDTTRYLLEILE